MDKDAIERLLLEILEKYRESEETVIADRSDDFNGDWEKLKKEVAAYKDRIKKLLYTDHASGG